MTEADEGRPGAATLTGAFNFRDLGGLPTAGGRRTRSGLLFRSDTLQALTEADVAHLIRPLGVMLVMDLRDAGEAIGEGRATLDFYLGHLDPGSPVLPLALQILAVALTRPAVRINERFQGWPRYREHMAAADPELYRVQERAIQASLHELEQRHGGARRGRVATARPTRCPTCSRTAGSRAELADPQERPAKETSEQLEDLQLTTTRENTLRVFSRI